MNSLSNQALARLVKRSFPLVVVPLTGELSWVTAYAVCRAESGGNPFACGDPPSPEEPGISIGLWQIHTPGGSRVGFTRDELFDPDNNAIAAAIISSQGVNWNAWCTWEESACGGNGTGSYRSFLQEARSALALPPPIIEAAGAVLPVLLGLGLIVGGIVVYNRAVPTGRQAQQGGMR